MNNMTVQMSEETTREDEISEAMVSAGEALHNLRMIKTTADYVADALVDRNVNTARIEPPRDCRRLFCLSHAATAVSATLA